MINSKVSPLLTPRFVSETLKNLFRPGEIITARVETLAGRLITLWVGGERLEALLSDTLPPHLFKPGQHVRLKVVQTGPPLVLSLSTEAQKEKTPAPDKLLPRLLQSLAAKFKQDIPSPEPTLERSSFEETKFAPEKNFSLEGPQNFEAKALKDLVENEIPSGRTLKEEALAQISRPVPDLSKEEALGLKGPTKPVTQGEQPYEGKVGLLPETVSKHGPDKLGARLLRSQAEKGGEEIRLEKFLLTLEEVATKSKEGLQGKEHLKEIRDLLLKWWQEGQFVVPFLFGDRVSWSYLCEKKAPSSRGKKGSAFVLKVFLPRLGFLEAHFLYARDLLELNLYFAREEVLALARKELPLLQEMLGPLKSKVVVKCDELGVWPGVLLAREV